MPNAALEPPKVGRARSRPASVITWLNLVCLDAPLVAVVWQEMFARAFHAEITFASRAALFLTAWLIYLGDRFADVRSIDADGPLSVRQAFCLRHRRAFLRLVVVVACLNAVVVLALLDDRTRLAGSVVGAVAMAYLIINHSLGRAWRYLPLKELSIGFVFAAGCVTSVAVAIAERNAAFYFAAIFFGLLCTNNCMSIAVWERTLDLAQGRHSVATRFAFIARILPASGLAIAMLMAGCAPLVPGATALMLCMAASFALLAFLGSAWAPCTRDERVALADIVLLTPIVFLIARAW